MYGEKLTEAQEQVLIQAQLALQCFEKEQIEKEELETIMGICFKTGKPSKDWDELTLHQILMQLSDEKVVTEDVVRKCLFNLPPKEN